MKLKTSLIAIFFGTVLTFTMFVINIPATPTEPEKEQRPLLLEPASYPESIPIIDVDFTPDKQIPLPNRLQLHIWIKAKDSGMDYKLLLALIEQESQFNINAINYNSNGTFDSGLCQINSCNFPAAEQLGYNLDCPYDNVEYACLMLEELLGKYDLETTLAAYNAGEAGMRKGYGREYARSVLDKMYR